MITKLLISLLISIFILYCLFCMFLTCVALPLDSNHSYCFSFKENPKGFIKYSRIFGLILMWSFILLIMMSIGYGVLSR